MNMSTSEPSSECESGWTNYLDESSNSEGDEECRNRYRMEGVGQRQRQQQDGKEDEEDLSMVSDASSGPTQQVHQESVCGKTRLSKQHKASNLDDTASSTFANPRFLTMKNEILMEHDDELKGKFGFQNEIGLLKMPSSQKSGSSTTKRRSGNVKKGCELAATACSVVK